MNERMNELCSVVVPNEIACFMKNTKNKYWFVSQVLVSTIDFRYITDVITADEAIALLHEKQLGRKLREEHLRKHGYPAYTTQIGSFF